MTGRDAVSQGTLLGGRVTYRQTVTGYRTGIEPIVLAASVPARAGDRVVEAGTGAGAGLLALAARIGDFQGLGIERDPDLAALARDNLAANGLTGIDILCADVTTWRPGAVWDHAMANPPWHDPAGTASPDSGRQGAKFAPAGGLESWCAALGACLRRRGTLSLILPAASLTQGVTALMVAGCAETTVLPLWPHRDEPAKLLILRGIRDGRGASRLLPGVVLHEADGSYTATATRILRQAAPL